MTGAKFILSKKKLLEQVKILENIGLKISYSYKTNKEVGNILQGLCPWVYFSVHAKEEIDMIEDKSKIWFFSQAESVSELGKILGKGVRNFVIDNEIDLQRIVDVVNDLAIQINLSLRMKFKEHRVGSGKYFVYGMFSEKVNSLIRVVKDNPFIEKLGIHIHRKSQNTSEWRIQEELGDSLERDVLEIIDFVNLGGGIPVEYRSYTSKVSQYIFGKLDDARRFLDGFGIETIIEPGRFIAAPSIKLITEIIQMYNGNIVLNTTIYNCALDCILTGTKMLVEGELDEGGKVYLLKGNSPTRDDIFRYKVRLKNLKVGERIVFLNAGAYNYSTDFFGYKKLKTEIVEDF
jgi:ornithine decarboxylase